MFICIVSTFEVIFIYLVDSKFLEKIKLNHFTFSK